MAEYSIGLVRSLLAAADQLLPETAPTSTEDDQRAVLYLSLLACEITLKALLEQSGHRLPDIREMSHNLAALLDAVANCRVNEGGRSRSASSIRVVASDKRFRNATLGHLLGEEMQGASRYPNNVRYGDLVRHFPAPVMRDVARALLGWAEKHGATIHK